MNSTSFDGAMLHQVATAISDEARAIYNAYRLFEQVPHKKPCDFRCIHLCVGEKKTVMLEKTECGIGDTV